ncbi:MAG: DUF4382 domain-containing protein [Dysgonamonadaceae bacterium]|nr:DUF4382 domain-containing protein [Dysgonamonadaceae bacterium]MDD4728729.1 DUF4382 domain-containing protein [Dysgonamonadaceae bacterium]
MKIFRNLLFLTLGLAVFASCSSDDEKVIPEGEKSPVQVVLRSIISNDVETYKAEVNPLNLEALYMNIAEIEFEISDEMEDVLPGGDKVYTDVELKGPFPINLLSKEVQNGLTLSTTKVPNGIYDEIEFEFDVYKGEHKGFENLLGNTIYASGSFDLGEIVIPFVIKSKEEMEVELEYENEPLVLDGSSSKIFIDINLDKVVLELINNAAVDFAGATKEEDGSILIDKNTNSNILKKFEKALEMAFEAIEDAHEDKN